MAEKEQAHRHSVEETAIKGHINKDRRGQICAFLVVLIMVGCSTYLITEGHEKSGGALVGFTLLGIVSIFVSGHFRSYFRGKSKKDSDSEESED